MPGTMDSRSNRGTGKLKVKSGCRTCKTRKVKCDEVYPACQRCTSTGRICEGYGIWGGGGNFYSHRQRLISANDGGVAPGPPASVSALAIGNEETAYFEWFKCRAATKLPGSFISSFWTTLLFQASLNEPAVLHAVLALSSVHKRGIIHSAPNEQERFTLLHYVKAISHLQPHFLMKNRASFRVALITCVVFVCLELLRGHFKTAQIHLQNGIEVLGEMQMLSSGNDETLPLDLSCESTDNWIVQAISRLRLQVELFKHTYQHPHLALQAPQPEAPACLFHSINEAWQQMERLLNNIFDLTYQGRQQASSECEPLRYSPALLEHQQRIRTKLVQWLDKYETFRKALQGHRSVQEEKGYQLLRIYHTMADIMADTCLQTDDEMIFDSHTDQFVLLIEQLAKQWTISSTTSHPQALPGHLMDMSRSIIDMGWIPLLYYPAIKCRVHRIRLQAIRLLESTSHREGIWDATMAACVARKVMEIEEGDFYRDIHTADDFLLSSSPRPEDLSLPTIPESHRIREVEVILSDAPTDDVLLLCKQRQEGIDRRILISRYNVQLQRWIDGRCG